MADNRSLTWWVIQIQHGERHRYKVASGRHKSNTVSTTYDATWWVAQDEQGRQQSNSMAGNRDPYILMRVDQSPKSQSISVDITQQASGWDKATDWVLPLLLGSPF